jgi:DNA-binding transcriptional LysR family regulator
LREGLVDLEIGIIRPGDPEIRSQTLVTDTLVAAVRPEHPLAQTKNVTPHKFAAAEHIVVSRRGRAHGPIDDRLAELGLQRRVTSVVPSFASALHVTRATDVVCVTPARLGLPMLDTLGLHTFRIPLTLQPVTIGMAWHPRNDNDRVHELLRERTRHIMATGGGVEPPSSR